MVKDIVKDIKDRISYAESKLKEIDSDIKEFAAGDYIDMNLYEIHIELKNYIKEMHIKLKYWED